MNIKVGRRLLEFIILYSLSLSFISCAGDCKEVKIEKVEWITWYEGYSKDTLVSYSIVENTTTLMEQNNATKDNITHTITIHNNNSSYSNNFSVRIDYEFGFKTIESSSTELDYVEISPNTDETFTYSWRGSQGGKDSDFKSFITILQIPERVNLKRRIDELKTETITVNTCQQSVEALQEKYNAIKKLYNEKVKK